MAAYANRRLNNMVPYCSSATNRVYETNTTHSNSMSATESATSTSWTETPYVVWSETVVEYTASHFQTITVNAIRKTRHILPTVRKAIRKVKARSNVFAYDKAMMINAYKSAQRL